MSRSSPEDLPLLPTRGSHPHGRTKVTVEEDPQYWDDDWDADEVLFADKKKRGTSLILLDTFLVILNFLQLLCIILSMAMRWPLPEEYLRFIKFVFVFNLDIWELTKLTVPDVYKSVQNYYTPSSLIPINYSYLIFAWGAVAFVIVVSFVIAYLVINHKKNPFMFIQIAKLQWVYLVILQVLALPIGVALIRLFHCTPTHVTDVDNSVTCWSGVHWAYIGPSIAVLFALFILIPAWLISKSRQEILNMTTERHEGYLQLKETEYVQGLDILWLVSGFHIFSSFKRYGAYLRPTLFLLELVLLVLYGFLFQFINIQALSILGILAVMLIAFFIVRPYRIPAFNVMLILNYTCLAGFCLIGTLKTFFDSITLRSPWLTPTYLLPILYIVSGVWFFLCLLFVLYLLLKHFGAFARCSKEPLWPTLTSRGVSKLSSETRKYMRTILRARHVLEKCLSMAAIFAPVHELSRQIQIVNAFCREAEYLGDPIHDLLWDLLDELIEAHEKIAPQSLFSESVKSSIRQTAAELMKVMPQFSRRLAQREYDFILVEPVKRRLLLKMYILGLFLNGRHNKTKKAKFTESAMNRIWRLPADENENEVDDGYYEELYPEGLQGPQYRPVSAFSLDMNSDDEEAILAAEIWAEDHPLSRQAPLDAYDDDVSALLGDEDSINLDEMMEGIPSLPRSAQPRSSSRVSGGRRSALSRGGRRIRPSALVSRSGSSLSGSQTSSAESAGKNQRRISSSSRPSSTFSQGRQSTRPLSRHDSAASMARHQPVLPQIASPVSPQQENTAFEHEGKNDGESMQGISKDVPADSSQAMVRPNSATSRNSNPNAASLSTTGGEDEESGDLMFVGEVPDPDRPTVINFPEGNANQSSEA